MWVTRRAGAGCSPRRVTAYAAGAGQTLTFEDARCAASSGCASRPTTCARGSRSSSTSSPRSSSPRHAAGGCGASSAASLRAHARALLLRARRRARSLGSRPCSSSKRRSSARAASSPRRSRPPHPVLLKGEGLERARAVSEKATAKLVEKGRLHRGGRRRRGRADRRSDHADGLLRRARRCRLRDRGGARTTWSSSTECSRSSTRPRPATRSWRRARPELSITEIGEITLRPDKVVGFHFRRPAARRGRRGRRHVGRDRAGRRDLRAAAAPDARCAAPSAGASSTAPRSPPADGPASLRGLPGRSRRASRACATSTRWARGGHKPGCSRAPTREGLDTALARDVRRAAA